MVPTVVTFTANPSLDTTATAERVDPDTKIRCTEARHDPGGGGINVARALTELGTEAAAVWVKGSLYGDLIGRMLDARGVEHHPVDADGDNRQSFAVIERDSERHFRFSTPGPGYGGEEVERMASEVRRLRPDVLVLSGGIPDGAPVDTLRRLASPDVAGEATVVLDTHGPPLLAALEGGDVDVVKPNYRELREAAGQAADEEFDVAAAARKLMGDRGAGSVLVSLGAGGALLVSDGDERRLSAPTVPIRSRIGAGDSMTAGLVSRLVRGDEVAEAARFAVAAGTAAVMTPGTELCRAEDVKRLVEAVEG